MHSQSILDHVGGPTISGVYLADGYVQASRISRNIHGLVMEAILGRPLLPGENVHHRNGVRYDNHPANLELWVVSQPAGQRPDDLVAWARKILARYGGDDASPRAHLVRKEDDLTLSYMKRHEAKPQRR